MLKTSDAISKCLEIIYLSAPRRPDGHCGGVELKRIKLAPNSESCPHNLNCKTVTQFNILTCKINMFRCRHPLNNIHHSEKAQHNFLIDNLRKMRR